MIVQSLGSLAQAGETPWYSGVSRRTVRLYDGNYQDYATLYRTQPNVRLCVDFLARNLAQLGLHVFRRVSDTDRERLTDHPVARLIGRPNPWTTRYRLIESLMGDLGIYFNAYWLKVGPPRPSTGSGWEAGADGMALLRVPPNLVRVYGGLGPRRYEVELGGTPLEVDPADMVHFRGYNPENPAEGLSPLETLRRTLVEEQAMSEYRENFWKNSARMNGVIERPRESPNWSEAARERFKEEFEALYTGGANSAKTAILEEGMTWKEMAFSAQQSELSESRKLTREECARAYHIPLPMVGILDHATFSNISEQHKNLYQDCMGPWTVMIQDDLGLQLVAELPDAEDVYCEFNIQEKLRGSFEDQTKALQSAVGRPWMTANEARARMNLPRVDAADADELVTPLNVLVGGQASPRDAGKEIASSQRTLLAMTGAKEEGAMILRPAQDANCAPTGGMKAAAGMVDVTLPALRGRHEEKWRRVMRRHFERQREALVGKVHELALIDVIWDGERWDRELAADLLAMGSATAIVWAREVWKALESSSGPSGDGGLGNPPYGEEGEGLDEDVMLPWLEEEAGYSARHINETTKTAVEGVLLDEDPVASVKRVFELAIGVRAVQIAASRVTMASNFGAQSAARQGGLRTKMWQVNSSNPRPEHAMMDGETVPITGLFSNGLLWPGDPTGGAENNANCQCSAVFGR